MCLGVRSSEVKVCLESKISVDYSLHFKFLRLILHWAGTQIFSVKGQS